MLLDPTCMVYKPRNLTTYGGGSHDRPQCIVNFLSDHAVDGVQPPFLLATCQPLLSLPTESIARAFCRETWWFLDGLTMRFPRSCD